MKITRITDLIRLTFAEFIILRSASFICATGFFWQSSADSSWPHKTLGRLSNLPRIAVQRFWLRSTFPVPGEYQAWSRQIASYCC
jgi:hypothetical protein